MLLSTIYKDEIFINFLPEFNVNPSLSKKPTVSWDELFTEIRFLWDKDDEDDNEAKLENHIKNLDQFLATREQPPISVVMKYCKSGLFVDMFRSMKTTKYRSYILNIICQIIKQFPNTHPLFIQRDLSQSFDQFLFSEGISPSMQIEAPFYTAKYLKCISKIAKQPFSFFFSPTDKGTYFQLCVQMILKAFSLEEETMGSIYHPIIHKTEAKILTIFSRLIPAILSNSTTPPEKNEDIQQIFNIFSTVFEMKLIDLYSKLIKSLYHIWINSSCQLKSFFLNESFIIPISALINEQFQPALKDSIRLFSEISFVEPDILSQINPVAVFDTANSNFSPVSNNYSEITHNSIRLLGQFIDFTNSFDPCQIDLNVLFGLCDASICDMNYAAHESVAFLLFSLMNVSRLTFFQDETNYKANLIIDAFDTVISQPSKVIGKAINAASMILSMVESGDEFAAQFLPTVGDFIDQLKQSIDDLNDYCENINHLDEQFRLIALGE